jgi:hypothetical protein
VRTLRPSPASRGIEALEHQRPRSQRLDGNPHRGQVRHDHIGGSAAQREGLSAAAARTPGSSTTTAREHGEHGEARNIFLDGNTFQDSRSVDKEPLTGDL